MIKIMHDTKPELMRKQEVHKKEQRKEIKQRHNFKRKVMTQKPDRGSLMQIVKFGPLDVGSHALHGGNSKSCSVTQI